MTLPANTKDPLEDSLVELEAARRAGVFRPTALHPRWMVECNSWAEVAVRLRWRLFTPFAAAALLAFIVWTAMFRSELTNLRLATQASSKGSLSEVTFASCLAGPGLAVSADCLELDLDADADVDLADYRAYQQRHALALAD